MTSGQVFDILDILKEEIISTQWIFHEKIFYRSLYRDRSFYCHEDGDDDNIFHSYGQPKWHPDVFHRSFFDNDFKSVILSGRDHGMVPEAVFSGQLHRYTDYYQQSDMGDFDFHDLCINKAMANFCKIEFRRPVDRRRMTGGRRR